MRRKVGQTHNNGRIMIVYVRVFVWDLCVSQFLVITDILLFRVYFYLRIRVLLYKLLFLLSLVLPSEVL